MHVRRSRARTARVALGRSDYSGISERMITPNVCVFQSQGVAALCSHGKEVHREPAPVAVLHLSAIRAKSWHCFRHPAEVCFD